MKLRLLEVIVILAIFAILAAIAIPSYQQYTRRAYYKEVVTRATPFRSIVSECVQNLGTLTGCDSGTNNIPDPKTTAIGPIASVVVTSGVITVTPITQNGVVATDTYILTPTLSDNGNLTWASSGGAVTNGYVR